MKTSVYIPDDLWQRVQEAQPEASASQLLQDCLRARFEDKAPSYAVLTDAQRQHQTKVVKDLEIKLRDTYQTAYNVGLKAVEEIPTFELLWLLASVDFDLKLFVEATQDTNYEDSDGAPFDVYLWWNDINNMMLDGDSYLREIDDLPYVGRKGIADAMRFAWDAVSGEAAVGTPHPGRPRAARPAPAIAEEAPDAVPE